MPFGTAKSIIAPKTKLTEQKQALEQEVAFIGQKIEEAEAKEKEYKDRTKEVESLFSKIKTLNENFDKKNSEFEILLAMITDREKVFSELKDQIKNRISLLLQDENAAKTEKNILTVAIKSLTTVKQNLFYEIEKENKRYEALRLANENIEKKTNEAIERYTKKIITFKGEMDILVKELQGKEKLLADKKKLSKEITEKEALLENTRLDIDTAQIKLIETNKTCAEKINIIEKTVFEHTEKMNKQQQELEAKEHELAQREVLLDKQKRYLKGFKEKLEMKLGTPLENITI